MWLVKFCHVQWMKLIRRREERVNGFGFFFYRQRLRRMWRELFQLADLCLQCFDAVGWVAGRASGLLKTEW